MLIADLPGDGLAPRRTRPDLGRGDGTADRVKRTAHLCVPGRLARGDYPTALPKPRPATGRSANGVPARRRTWPRPSAGRPGTPRATDKPDNAGWTGGPLCPRGELTTRSTTGAARGRPSSPTSRPGSTTRRGTGASRSRSTSPADRAPSGTSPSARTRRPTGTAVPRTGQRNSRLPTVPESMHSPSRSVSDVTVSSPPSPHSLTKTVCRPFSTGTRTGSPTPSWTLMIPSWLAR
jgi:hypothetical protein